MPDIILMDLSLPGMDGWEATRRLKADERTRAHPDRRADRPRARRHVGGRAAGRLRRVRDQAVPARRARGGDPADADRRTREPRRRSRPHARPRQVAQTMRARPRPKPAPRSRSRGRSRASRRPGRARPRAAAAAADAAAAAAAAARAGGRRRRAEPRRARTRAERAADGRAEGKYVYCIIESASRCGSARIGIGAEPAEVHTVTTGTSPPWSPTRRSRSLGPDARERARPRARQRDGDAQHTVIPMSFGTVFKTDDDIVELLRSAYDAFSDVLNKMQDKLEFGLKVLWDRDQIDPRDRGGGRGHPPAEERDLVAEGLDLLRAHAVRPADRRGAAGAVRALRRRDLRARCATCRSPRASNKPIGDKMIMNAAFLVVARRGAGVRRAGSRRSAQQLRQADVQVHRPVAAVQLRQHPAEAGARALRHRSVHPRHAAHRRPPVRARQGRRGGRGRAERRHRAARAAARGADARRARRDDRGEFAAIEARHPRAHPRDPSERQQRRRGPAASRPSDTRSPASRRRSKATSTKSGRIAVPASVLRRQGRRRQDHLRRGLGLAPPAPGDRVSWSRPIPRILWAMLSGAPLGRRAVRRVHGHGPAPRGRARRRPRRSRAGSASTARRSQASPSAAPSSTATTSTRCCACRFPGSTS